MTLFFKRLRQKLLIQKKFGKYLLYVFGEIMIVIIGILVAVEVNNRNERRQDRAVEIVILKAFKAGLESDLIGFSNDSIIHESQIASSQIIIDHLENNLPYNDSLSKHFLETCNATIISTNRGAFETLKSLGVGLISNADLREDIIYLYDAHYDFMSVFANGILNDNGHAVREIYNSRFYEGLNYYMELGENLEAVVAVGSMIPIDFDQLKNDREYKYHLKTTKNLNKIYLDVLNDAKSKISEIILSIDAEVKSLEK